MKTKILFVFFFFYISVFCEMEKVGFDRYYQTLKKLNNINESKSLPIIYNQMCQSGYFTMPSAKMADSGVVAFSYSNSNPYKIIGLNLQYFNRLEISVNFWIYKNILEGCFGKMGYGEDADRVANLKFAVLSKVDNYKLLPEIIIGINDFYGSKRFHSKYVVLTKQFINNNFEFSLGYGIGRIKGFFYAMAYFPFYEKKHFFKSLGIFLEYDANNYKNNIYEHPKGKKINFPINMGLNFNFFNLLQGSLSSIRGDKIGGTFSLKYNLGQSKGLFPKFYDKPISKKYPYLKTEDNLSNNLVKTFKDQGFDLIKISYYYNSKEKKVLCLKIINLKYRSTEIVRLRIQNILSNCVLEDYSNIVITVESDGIDLHEYCFKKKYLDNFNDNKIGFFELKILCPIKDVFLQKDCNSIILYERKKQVWTFTFHPKMNMFFGSCKGKFKYDGGFLLSQEGYFFNQLYYNLQASYILKTASAQVGSRDKYNPSQIINIRSDFTKYYETNTFHIDTCYIQKNWTLKKALFCKLAIGYFEVAYAGSALECLYYPINSNFACSIEAANVYKRKYSGFGFQNKIRKWNNCSAEYEKFIGLQYFLNLFYELKPLNLTFKISLGQFLAKDQGIKLEIIRYFSSGFEILCWITFTNKKDFVNNKRYFDKGVAISIPLDIFMNKSSRKRIYFKISEWLRDVGAKAKTGRELYHIIHDERYFL